MVDIGKWGPLKAKNYHRFASAVQRLRPLVLKKNNWPVKVGAACQYGEVNWRGPSIYIQLDLHHLRSSCDAAIGEIVKRKKQESGGHERADLGTLSRVSAHWAGVCRCLTSVNSQKRGHRWQR